MHSTSVTRKGGNTKTRRLGRMIGDKRSRWLKFLHCLLVLHITLLRRGSEKLGMAPSPIWPPNCILNSDVSHALPLTHAQRIRPRGALRIYNAGNTNMLSVGGCFHHGGWVPVSGQFGPRVHPHLSGEPIFYVRHCSSLASDHIRFGL